MSYGERFVDLLRGQGLVSYVALAVIVLFVLVLLAMLGLIAHHEYTSLKRKLFRDRTQLAVTLLAAAIVDPAAFPGAVEQARRRAGARATASVLREFRLRLKGKVGALMSKQLERLGEVDRLGALGGARRMWLRRAAARGLAECGGARAGRYLRQLLQDSHPEVRRTARTGLLASGDTQSVRTAINSYLRDASAHQGWKAAFYARLALVAPEEIRTLLTRGRVEGVEEKLALEALGESRDPEAVRFAAERLDAELPELRATAVRVLGRLRRDEFRDRILAALKDPAWFVRAAAAKALESMGEGPSADAALAAALQDREWWVRANVARALARRGESGLRHLIDAVQSDDRFARDAALAALASSGKLLALQDKLPALLAAHPDDPTLQALVARA